MSQRTAGPVVTSAATAERNAALVRRFADALSRWDLETIAWCLDGDVVLHHAGRHRAAGTFTGKYEILGIWLGKLIELVGRSLRVEVHDIVASEGHVVQISRVSATRQGHHLEWPALWVFHIAAGRISEIWAYDTDPYAVDAFLSA